MPPLDRPILFAATQDAARSREFYEDILELRFVADEPWALVFDVAGTMLRIQRVERLPEIQHTVLGWAVDDIRQTVVELTGRGVQFNRFDQLDQDEDGVWHAPGGAKIAWFSDPDGNTLSLTQH